MKLFKISHELWAFNYKDRKALMVEGLPELFVVAQKLEIPFTEMEAAIMDMEKQENNCAEFGIWRNFTVSRKV